MKTANDSTDKICYRRMQKEDVQAVSEIEKSCFSAPWTYKSFMDSLLNPDMIYIIAEFEGEVIGNCGVRNILGEGEITNVAMKESYRGQGIATKMMKKLLKCGEEMGITDFTLEVRKGNLPAVNMYQKLGFKIEGVRKNFYSNPREDACIMWKRKSFEDITTSNIV